MGVEPLLTVDPNEAEANKKFKVDISMLTDQLLAPTCRSPAPASTDLMMNAANKQVKTVQNEYEMSIDESSEVRDGNFVPTDTDLYQKELIDVFGEMIPKKDMTKFQHYSELPDIKRVIVNTHAIEPQALVEFYGSGWATECMKYLFLVNLQIIIQACKQYSEQLGVDACIKLFEQFKSYQGLYLRKSEDHEIHFKYIEAASKTGQIKERESNFYDAEKKKNF